MRNFKKQHMPGQTPEEFLGVERTKIPLPGIGSGKGYAELKIGGNEYVTSKKHRKILRQ